MTTQGIEAGTATTAGRGAQHESPVGRQADAPETPTILTHELIPERYTPLIRDREAIARIVDPGNWSERERLIERAEHWEREGVNDTQRNLGALHREEADRIVAPSLAKTDAILALPPITGGEAGLARETAERIIAQHKQVHIVRGGSAPSCCIPHGVALDALVTALVCIPPVKPDATPVPPSNEGLREALQHALTFIENRFSDLSPEKRSTVAHIRRALSSSPMPKVGPDGLNQVLGKAIYGILPDSADREELAMDAAEACMIELRHRELVTISRGDADARELLAEINWLILFSNIRSADSQRVAAKVQRGAMRTISDRLAKLRAALAKTLEAVYDANQWPCPKCGEPELYSLIRPYKPCVRCDAARAALAQSTPPVDREAVLEEAAKVADEKARAWSRNASDHNYDRVREAAAHEIAAATRALKSPQAETATASGVSTLAQRLPE